MKFKLILPILLAFFIFQATGMSQVPIGWASVDALDQNGTTGGEGGEVIVVNTMAELIAAAGQTDTIIIEVNGMIPVTPKGRFIEVNSHKTIIGKIPGSGISEGGFRVGSGKKNIIFRNLTIRDTYLEGDWDGKDQDWDGIQLKGTCHHIWIDKCTLLRQGDGAVDITNGASYVTISHSIFGENNKASLIGSSDSDSNTESYKVTVHNTWYNETTQRNPRVRFGMVHLFNNYYYNMGGYGREMGYSTSNGYGVGIGVSAKIVSENNVFEDVVNPSQFYDNNSLPGFMSDAGSIFVQSGNILTADPGTGWNPLDFYDYTLLDADLVKDSVMNYAGAEQADPNTSVPYLAERNASHTLWPNPVKGRATISFFIPEANTVEFNVYDLSGRVIKTLQAGFLPAGNHTTPISTDDLNPGIYLLQLKTYAHQSTVRMVVQ